MPPSPKPEPSTQLSVIVAVYNVEPWLRRCMNSLCGQSYPHLQIICVDDGSTDASLCILREYEARDSRVQVLHQENRGPSAARNAGLRVATGEWITFLDPDDALHPTACATAMAHTEGVDAVYFGVRILAEDAVINCDSLQQQYQFTMEGIHRPIEAESLGLPSMVNNKLLKRSILEQYGLSFHEDMRPGEDSTLWREYCLVARKLCMLPQQLYDYYQRANSTMHRREYTGRPLPYILRMHGYLQERLKQEGASAEHIELYKGWLAADYAWMTAECKDYMSEEEVRAAFCQPVRQNKLWQYPQLRWQAQALGAAPKWWKLFVTSSMTTTTWRLLGIPLFKCTARSGYRTYRLLGITLCRRPL